jgi:hypothetical protein
LFHWSGAWLAPLPSQQIKLTAPDFERLALTVPDSLFGILWNEAFELRLSILMREVGLSGAAKDVGEFGPGIGRGHVYDPHRLNARPRRFNAE